MRRHAHRARFVDEVFGVIALVGRERDPRRAVSARLDHMQSRDAFGMAIGGREAGVD